MILLPFSSLLKSYDTLKRDIGVKLNLFVSWLTDV